MDIRFSEKTQMLLDSFRLLEQARAKYSNYLLAITEGAGFPEQYEDFAKATDMYWDPIREKIQDDLQTALYEWANAEDNRNEI
jgi:hypothetical protein